MTAFLWRWLCLPLAHWLAVSLAILAVEALVRGLREAARLEGRCRALIAPVRARSVQVTVQVTRADGTAEPPMTIRAHRNPLRRWAWAIGKALRR
jgi:hypothetical protein